MKTSFIPLASLAVAFLAPVLTAQVIINDDMESYTTATPTSVDSTGTGNPANWSKSSFSDGGTVDVTAGITGSTGSRAAILTADFSNATGFWGAQLFTEAKPNSATASSFSDFTFSLSALTSNGNPFTLQFISFDNSFQFTGSRRATFDPALAGTFETFSGTLGDAGWAANPFFAGGSDLALNAPYYSWEIEFGSNEGFTNSAGNSAQVDQISLAIVPEPSSVWLAIGAAFFAFVIHRRRFLKA